MRGRGERGRGSAKWPGEATDRPGSTGDDAATGNTESGALAAERSLALTALATRKRGVLPAEEPGVQRFEFELVYQGRKEGLGRVGPGAEPRGDARVSGRRGKRRERVGGQPGHQYVSRSRSEQSKTAL
jgi:hypothetical protein